MQKKKPKTICKTLMSIFCVFFIENCYQLWCMNFNYPVNGNDLATTLLRKFFNECRKGAIARIFFVKTINVWCTDNFLFLLPSPLHRFCYMRRLTQSLWWWWWWWLWRRMATASQSKYLFSTHWTTTTTHIYSSPNSCICVLSSLPGHLSNSHYLLVHIHTTYGLRFG